MRVHATIFSLLLCITSGTDEVLSAFERPTEEVCQEDALGCIRAWLEGGCGPWQLMTSPKCGEYEGCTAFVHKSKCANWCLTGTREQHIEKWISDGCWAHDGVTIDSVDASKADMQTAYSVDLSVFSTVDDLIGLNQCAHNAMKRKRCEKQCHDKFDACKNDAECAAWLHALEHRCAEVIQQGREQCPADVVKTAAYASVAFNSVTGLWENDNIHDMMYNVLNGCYDPPPEDDSGMHAHIGGDDGPASPLRQPRATRGDDAWTNVDERRRDDRQPRDDNRSDDRSRDDKARDDEDGMPPAEEGPKYTVVDVVSRHIMEFDKVLQDPLVRHYRAYLVMAAMIPILATAFYVYRDTLASLVGSN